MGFRERAEERRKRIVARVVHGHEDTDESDLDFWQSFTPQDRLSVAFVMSEAVEQIMPRRRRRAT